MKTFRALITVDLDIDNNNMIRGVTGAIRSASAPVNGKQTDIPDLVFKVEGLFRPTVIEPTSPVVMGFVQAALAEMFEATAQAELIAEVLKNGPQHAPGCPCGPSETPADPEGSST